MKKIIPVILAATAVMGSSAYAKTMEVTIGSDVVYTSSGNNVESSKLAAAAYIENDITMIPLRFVSETMGAEVTWNGEDSSILLKKDGKEIKLVIGEVNSYVKTNAGTELATLVAPPVILNDITLVPLRFVSEQFNAYVEYVEATRQVIISDETAAVTVNGARLDKEMFRTMHRVNSAYQMYYGPDLYNEIIYTNALTNEAVIQKWTAKNSDFKLPEDAIKALEQTPSEDLAKSGLLKSYLAKVYFADYIVSNYYNDLLVSFDDEAITKEYEANYVRAKHILIQTVDPETGATLDDKAKAEMKKKAEGILTKIKKGQDFDKLMAEYSEDPGSHAQPDGYVFTYGQMVEEFEKASFELEENKVSGLVETDYGYHIIKKLPLPKLDDSLKTEISQSLADKALTKVSEEAEVKNNMSMEDIISYMSYIPEVTEEK